MKKPIMASFFCFYFFTLLSMYSRFQLFLRFCRYYYSASNSRGHGMHSPFVYDFIGKVLNAKTSYKSYEVVEALRKKLKTNNQILTIEDFGAGSSIVKSNQRSIVSIVKNAAKSKKFGQLLFRIVQYYKPQVIIELGTSLGITTSYLSLAKPDSQLITIEGDKAISEVSRKNFDELKLKNIITVQGSFESTLAGILEKLEEVNLAFIDGNHRKEPTERYFHQLLAKTNNDSILIFDDIHWSREMEQAWETIRNHPSVRCTIDLFFIGIVFFREEFHEKQHFVIRY
jgi:predicted O-methyltransferase YrrM